jgi:aminomethyltransferase
MIRTTPFHPRLEELNQTGLWSHWAGYLTAEKYAMSAKHEYFAVRNSAGLFDTSPLYKYAVRGRDAERFLAGVLARDIRTCRPGNAQYTLWCDDRGFVIEDGVVFRDGDDSFMLTAAEPNLAYLSDLVGRLEVEIEDVSDQYAALAVQGPRSRRILSELAPEVERLRFFELCDAKIAGVPVTVSRTGYTGDLGYEVWVGSGEALSVLDAVLEAGAGHGVRPFGQQALLMTRIEAGLLLIDVDFHSSRYAFTDHDRSTPMELGLGWMFRNLQEQDRAFIGRRAIARALEERSARWKTVGLVVDWRDHDRLFTQAGRIPPKDEMPVQHETMLYDDMGAQAGYATSLMYSPVLQRHIGMARVRPQFGAVGSRVDVELTIDHEYRTVAATVARPPLFNPERKTA